MLAAPEPAARNAGATGLELLGDRAGRGALERALARATTRGEKALLERALEALA